MRKRSAGIGLFALIISDLLIVNWSETAKWNQHFTPPYGATYKSNKAGVKASIAINSGTYSTQAIWDNQDVG